MIQHTCPWWFAYTFDHRARRLFQKPERLLAAYVQPGMTVMDIGCGMGFFSIGMAGLVGDEGRVIAVDLQQGMLDVLLRRASRAGVAHRIRTHRCAADALGVSEPVDFILASWMMHEVRDKDRMLGEIRANLKPSGRFLFTEPKFHVSSKTFRATVETAQRAGLRFCEEPRVRLSYAALFDLPPS